MKVTLTKEDQDHGTETIYQYLRSVSIRRNAPFTL